MLNKNYKKDKKYVNEEIHIYKVDKNNVYYFRTYYQGYGKENDAPKTTVNMVNMKTGKDRSLGEFDFVMKRFDRKFAYGFRQIQEKNRITFYRYSLKTGNIKKIRVDGFSSIQDLFYSDTRFSAYNNKFLIADWDGNVFYGDFKQGDFAECGKYIKPKGLKKYYTRSVLVNNRNEFYVCFARSGTPCRGYVIVKYTLDQ